MQFQTHVPPLTLEQVFIEMDEMDNALNGRHAEAINQFNTLLANIRTNDLSLTQFLSDYGDSLFDAVTDQNRPLFTGQTYPEHEAVMDGLSRQLFDAQRDVVRAVNQLLLVEDKPAAIINAEMGTGKTMMAIAAAAVAHQAGYPRTLVLSPPHLVYKWRREILKTVPDARVWILNGTDTLAKLLQIRAMHGQPTVPEFFVLGRVRMRMGFHWRPAYAVRRQYRMVYGEDKNWPEVEKLFCCPKCGHEITDDDNRAFAIEEVLQADLGKSRRFCRHASGRGITKQVCIPPPGRSGAQKTR